MGSSTVSSQAAERYLKAVLAAEMQSPDTDFDSKAPFRDLGVDSFRVLSMVRRLEQDFGRLPKTLLFERFNIADLADYFASEHAAALQQCIEAQEVPAAEAVAEGDVSAAAPAPVASVEAPVSVPAPGADDGPGSPLPEVLLLHEAQALADPHWGPILEQLTNDFGHEASVSRGTRVIAPYLLMDSQGRGYFNIAKSNDVLLAYAYTGHREAFAPLLQQLRAYAQAQGAQWNLLWESPLGDEVSVATSATPFGAIQRMLDLPTFDLSGGRMRRLRYLVKKFAEHADCRTVEYRSGDDPATDAQIAALIDQWCEGKAAVNPLVEVARGQLLRGEFSPRHRLFLTYADDTLCNAVIISPMASPQPGYLMDLEFYPQHMALGGLEFAIVQIIRHLVGEGCTHLSLGATLGPKLIDAASADAEVDQVLDNLRRQGIFNDEGNLQFKNKFRTRNSVIYLCREVQNQDPNSALDVIMMIAQPQPQTLSTTDTAGAPTSTPAPAVGAAPQAERPRAPATGDQRRQHLEQAAFNVQNLSFGQVPIDCTTDSWAQLDSPAIVARRRELTENLHFAPPLDGVLRQVFPFERVVATTSGRSAEGLLFGAWERAGTVAQNLLFPSTLLHELDNDFVPVELLDPSLCVPGADERWRGGVDLVRLEEHLQRDPLAMVYVELASNGAGGLPVSLQHLKAVRALADRHEVPLLLDATRVLENALMCQRYERGCDEQGLWQLAQACMALGDVVVASLTKDFASEAGGVVATNDHALADRMQAHLHSGGHALDMLAQRRLALGLANRQQIEAGVVARVDAVDGLWQRLSDAQLPVHRPAGGHCVLLDVMQLDAFRTLPCPIPSFLAWLYLTTGVRAGAHSVGMQRETPLNGMVRLAIPVGMEPSALESIATTLPQALGAVENIPILAQTEQCAAPFGGLHGHFTLEGWAQETPAPTGAQEQEHVTAAAPSPAPATPAPRARASDQDDIAVVGMALRLPLADDADAFWHNLAEGVDCIRPLPEQRWARRQGDPGAHRYRGGFLDDVERFDSLFFKISPREAQSLDPQERQFLEVAWEALEDAAYCPSSLEGLSADRRIGVYVGAIWGMYQVLGAQQAESSDGAPDQFSVPNSFLWSIANRVSYVLDLNGPSMTLDTACSSSLAALSLACQALRDGQCDSAIVGGVNLDLHETKQRISEAGGALSADGLCRSFGDGANGYVPGEGVVALVLKPLAKAVADRDNIHGVIKAVGVNHGGKTSGYTVPSPQSQAQLIARCLEEGALTPAQIDYVEAHGTGTALGDPIEVHGLSLALAGGDATPVPPCPLGSLKSNIGHLEAAAGIAGVCKVLLQMRHGKLVPSLHAQPLNAHIDFEQTPVRVQHTLADWRSRASESVPLRAGVSSFGAGGTNGHVILEQHPAAFAPEDDAVIHPCPLSAKSEQQLRTYAEALAHKLADHPSLRVVDVAFTLQVGREPLEHRLVCLASDRQGLIAQLRAFAQGEACSGVLSSTTANLEEAAVDPVAADWVSGARDDWERAPTTARRVSLPTYPFAKVSHWLDEPVNKSLGEGAGERLHPLLHANSSDLHTLRFTTSLADDGEWAAGGLGVGEFRASLPASALLVNALVAASYGVDDGPDVSGWRLHDVRWAGPLWWSEALRLHTTVSGDPSVGTGRLQLEVCDAASGDVLCQGEASRSDRPTAPAPVYELASLRAGAQAVQGAACYDRLAALGVLPTPAQRVIAQVVEAPSGSACILELELPTDGDPPQAVHPFAVEALFHGALHVLCRDLGVGSCANPMLAEIAAVVCYAPVPARCVVALTRREAAAPGTHRFDARLCAPDGQVCVLVEDLHIYVGAAVDPAFPALVQATAGWVPLALPPAPPSSDDSHQPVLLLCDLPGELAGALRRQRPRWRIERSRARPEADIAALYEGHALRLFTLLQELAGGRSGGSRTLRVLAPATGDGAVLMGLSGMLKTAQLEIPGLGCQLVLVDADASVTQTVHGVERLMDAPAVHRVRLGSEGCEYLAWQPVEAKAADPACVPWKHDGVYLVTGGMGGVGRTMVREILDRAPGSRVVVLGRRSYPSLDQTLADAFGESWERVIYRAVDVCDSEALQSLMVELVDSVGALNGVLHCAGFVADQHLASKSRRDLFSVFGPKVRGTVALDQATRTHALDFFCLFSSAASVFGNVGQGDYAAANGFLDHYAQRRNELVAQGQRHGTTLSVNWPYWQQGGMALDEVNLDIMWRVAGTLPMSTAQGVQTLHGLLSVPVASQVLVTSGDATRLAQVLAQAEGETTASEAATPAPAVDEPDALTDEVTARAAQVLGQVIKLPPADIQVDEPFDSYGLDSLMITSLTGKLLEHFPRISQVVFFEYQTLRQLVEHLVEVHGEACRRWVGGDEEAASRVGGAVVEGARRRVLSSNQSARSRAAAAPDADERMAIVGLSGVYPQARSVEAFWDRLAQGADCITEVPSRRWSQEGFFEADIDRAVQEGKSYAKWGGFVDGFDEFDPQFFGISPRDATAMDPQERLFLQVAWQALEDAAITPAHLSERYARRVGVFAGITKTGFALHGSLQAGRGKRVLAHTSFGSIANRLSYFLDLTGPSMPIDTMCSSSLTAIHEACASIRRGECEIALAGGVNLYLHPRTYVELCSQRMLAADGRCRSFGAGASGFVPGEGAGVVVLKRERDAIADGDVVHGVILASQLNHGGRTTGYTVPSPRAQGELIRAAIDQAQISADEISYIEAHGTGTALGDPIELAGLEQAFGEAPERAVCHLGSAKSNIGHLEAAAGIAGLTKVLLQMRHRQLAPTLHVEQTNPKIDFTRSRFQLNTALAPWTVSDAEGAEGALIAGISSFGAGGANAHVLVREPSTQPQTLSAAELPRGAGLFVLSAKTEEQLRDRVTDLCAHLRALPAERLADPRYQSELAYTLQCGRAPMGQRLACVAPTLDALCEALEAWCDGRGDPSICEGIGAQPATDEPMLAPDAALAEIAAHWCVGAAVAFEELYAGAIPRRVALPPYRFRRQRFWIDRDAEAATPPAPPQRVQAPRARTVATSAPPSSRASPAVLASPGARPRPPAQDRAKPTAIALRPLRDEALAPTVPTSTLPKPTPPTEEAPPIMQANPPTNDAPAHPQPVNPSAETLGTLRQELRSSLAQALCASEEDIADTASFVDLGLDSIVGVEWINALKQQYGLELPAIVVYDHPNIEALALHLSSLIAPEAPAVPEQPAAEAKQAEQSPVAPEASATAHASRLGADAVEELLTRSLAEVLCLPVDEIDPARSFVEMGLDSIVGVEWINAINGELGTEIPTVAVYDHPTITALATWMATHVGVSTAAVPDTDTPEKAQGEPSPQAPSRAHHFHLEASAQAPLTDGEGEWSLRYLFSVENNRCLAEHLVFGLHMFPTDGFLELVYSAYRQLDPHSAVRLRDLRLRRALVMDAQDSAPVFVTFRRRRDGALEFSVASGEGRDLVHLSGCVETSDAYVASQLSRVDCGGRLRDYDRKAWYQGSRHMYVGEMYHSIRSVVFHESLAVAEIDRLDHGLHFLLDPSVLNAAVSSAMAYGPYQQDPQFESSGDVFIPYSIGEVAVCGDLDQAHYVALTRVTRAGGSTVELDLELLDGQGQLRIRMDRLVLVRVAQDTLKAQLADARRTASPPVVKAPAAKATPKRTEAPVPKGSERGGEDIAVIGVACRFPGSPTVEAFWDNLKAGRDCITEAPADRWQEYEGWYHPDPNHSGTAATRWGGFIDDIDKFDPLFFGISPAEAELIDPQQRVFLEECWKAIEFSGHAASELAERRCGVYVGCSTGDYTKLLANGGNDTQGPTFVGTSSAILAARISYHLDLRGTSLAVDTACSSSLTAIHLACESIRSGEHELALAGAVGLFSTPVGQILTSQVGMQSPDGRCFTFDAAANGTVFSEGCGVVLLKSLAQAERDHDTILGVIKASATNQDGRSNGITAPSSVAQQALLRDTYASRGLDPKDVGYIEAHGTATPLGDPIEVSALNTVFGEAGQAQHACALGSVKSNIGHAGLAAGMAGFIKALYCVREGTLVPSLHYQTPNPHIDLERSPFYVNTRTKPWPTEEGPRMAGVSSFGFSGTNAHVVVASHDAVAARSPSVFQGPLLVPVSAQTQSQLREVIADLAEYVGARSYHDLGAIAYTSQVGREPFKHRALFIAEDTRELAELLRAYLSSAGADGARSFAGKAPRRLPKAPPVLDELGLGGWLKRDGAEVLAEAWVGGVALPWQDLYGDVPPPRVVLPSYPFARDRHWISDGQRADRTREAVPADAQAGSGQHPQLHRKVTQGRIAVGRAGLRRARIMRRVQRLSLPTNVFEAQRLWATKAPASGRAEGVHPLLQEAKRGMRIAVGTAKAERDPTRVACLRRMSLPRDAFDSQRIWIEPPNALAGRAVHGREHPWSAVPDGAHPMLQQAQGSQRFGVGAATAHRASAPAPTLRRVSLPRNIFDSQRVWIDLPETQAPVARVLNPMIQVHVEPSTFPVGADEGGGLGVDRVAPGRASLPTESYDRQRYWTLATQLGEEVADPIEATGVLHPLVHRNLSDLRKVRFLTQLRGSESFLQASRTGDVRAPALSASCLVETARVAAEYAVAAGGLSTRVELTDVQWDPAYTASADPRELATDVVRKQSCQCELPSVLFEISETAQGRTLCQGTAHFGEQQSLECEGCGDDDPFQGLAVPGQAEGAGDAPSLQRFVITLPAFDESRAWKLHPQLIEALLAGWLRALGEPEAEFLAPVRVASIRLLRPSHGELHIAVRVNARSAASTQADDLLAVDYSLDVRIEDGNGAICCEIRGLDVIVHARAPQGEESTWRYALRGPSGDRHRALPFDDEAKTALVLRRAIARRRGIGSSQVDAGAPLGQFGFSGSELTDLLAAIGAALGAKPPILELDPRTSIAEVAATLAAHMGGELRDVYVHRVALGADGEEDEAIPPRRAVAAPARSVSTTVSPVGEAVGTQALFVVPGIGSDGTAFEPLAQALSDTYQLYVLEESAEAAGVLDSIEKKAAAHIKALQRVDREGPYRLLGHSYGGSIAYEVVRQLTASGADVQFLGLLDAMVPQELLGMSMDDQITMLRELYEFAQRMVGVDVRAVARGEPGESRSERFARALAEHQGRLNRRQEAILDALRQDALCYENYTPLAIDGDFPVYLWRAVERHPEMAPLADDYGWSPLADGRLHVRDVYANHFSMLGANHTDQLAALIGQSDIELSAQ